MQALVIFEYGLGSFDLDSLDMESFVAKYPGKPYFSWLASSCMLLRRIQSSAHWLLFSSSWTVWAHGTPQKTNSSKKWNGGSREKQESEARKHKLVQFLPESASPSVRRANLVHCCTVHAAHAHFLSCWGLSNSYRNLWPDDACATRPALPRRPALHFSKPETGLEKAVGWTGPPGLRSAGGIWTQSRLHPTYIPLLSKATEPVIHHTTPHQCVRHAALQRRSVWSMLLQHCHPIIQQKQNESSGDASATAVRMSGQTTFWPSSQVDLS